jgi:hypothetical protein
MDDPHKRFGSLASTKISSNKETVHKQPMLGTRYPDTCTAARILYFSKFERIRIEYCAQCIQISTVLYTAYSRITISPVIRII